MADVDSPHTPLNAGSRVHAWVRISGGATSGVDAEDAISVHAEGDAEAGTIVYASDGLGRRLQTATVDGVIRADAPLSSVSGDLLTPLVEHIVDAPSLKLGGEVAGYSIGLRAAGEWAATVGRT